MEIIPAILPKTFRDLEEKIALVRGLVETVQIDFCEGGFFLRQPLPFTDALDYEAHLMVTEPLALIPSLVKIGFSRILVHVESFEKGATGATGATGAKGANGETGAKGETGGNGGEVFAELIHEWRGAIEVGAALKIETPLETVGSFAHELSCLQLMGIAHIGRQGQLFDERVVARVGEAHARFPHLAIAVDGGVSLQNARALLDVGASRLVVGSAIFGADNPRAAIEQFKQLG